MFIVNLRLILAKTYDFRILGVLVLRAAQQRGPIEVLWLRYRR
jgi:hypothetical protein